MVFILDIVELANDLTKKRNIKLIEERWNSYHNYLESLKGKMPDSAYEFATAEWHYNFNDHRCPHDSWVEEFSLRTIESGSRWWYKGRWWHNKGRPGRKHLHKGYLGKRYLRSYLDIFVRLLGAYHDGHIELTYQKVCAFSISSPPFPGGAYPIGPGDWLYDEVRLSEQGLVEHEIRFDADTYWKFECEDIRYEWKPFSD